MADSSCSDPGAVPDEFTCQCCHDLLLNPVTLLCGHSFCQLCVVQWVKNSKQKTCLLCRQPFHGAPAISMALGRAIEERCPALLTQRQQKTTETEESIANGYETTMNESSEQFVSQQKVFLAFALGVICAVAAVAGLWLLYMVVSQYWAYANTTKPIRLWGPPEAQAWLQVQGELAESYSLLAGRLGVTGVMLLDESEGELMSRLKMTDEGQRDLLRTALGQLKETGLRQPGNLWELKAMYQQDVIFYLYALHHAPRVTILYAYVCDRARVFLQFLFSPSYSPAAFWLQAAFAPYYLLIKSVWAWSGLHPYACLFEMVLLVLCFVKDLLFMRKCWADGHPIQSVLQEIGLSFGVFLFYYSISFSWPLLPGIVWDVLFYLAVFVSPWFYLVDIVKIVLE